MKNKSSKFHATEIVVRLRGLASPVNVVGMARFGINPESTLGIPIPTLRGIAKEIGMNHALALELWNSGIHEARILAGFVDDPETVTRTQMDKWAKSFDSWDVCDQVCSNLFDRTKFAFKKAAEWSEREEEFVKREAKDERNFVRKAVNWALRQIGKRNSRLRRAAISTAKEIQELDSKAARWIATDALKELTGKAVSRKLDNR